MTTANAVTITLAERRRLKYKKYAASVKGHARRRRYDATAKGRATRRRKDEKCNARRLWIGRHYAGYAPVNSDVAAIRRHIRERLHEFREYQRADRQASFKD